MGIFSRKSKKKAKSPVDLVVDAARESEEELDTQKRTKTIEEEFQTLESRPEGLTTSEAQVREISFLRFSYLCCMSRIESLLVVYTSCTYHP